MSQHDPLSLPIIQAGELQKSSGYWRSLEELANTAEFHQYLHREFPPGIDQPTETSRRDFMRLMGASLLLAGATGCEFKQPLEKIVPAARLNAYRVPGTANYYTTAMDFAGSAVGLTVQARQGRPIKCEGNPLHPSSLGSTGIFQQAAILDLYNPDRLSTPLHHGEPASKKQFTIALKALADRCDADEGSELGIVLGTTTSPTVRRLLDATIERWPNATWCAIDSSGKSVSSNTAYVYDLTNANAIVSIGADFLSGRDWPPCYVRQFADARRIVGSQSKESPENVEMAALHSLGSAPSLTSAKADNSLIVKPSAVGQILIELATRFDLSIPSKILNTFDRQPLSKRWTSWIDSVEQDLKRNGKSSVVIVDPGMPRWIQLLAIELNAHLDAFGKFVRMIDSPTVQSSRPFLLRKNLIVLSEEPTRSPNCAKRFKEAEYSILLSQHGNASLNPTWTIPQSHFLETWSDARAHDGTPSIIQPLITPLYESYSDVELLSMLINDSESGYQSVRKTWKSELGNEDDDKRWETALATGIIKQSPPQAISPQVLKEDIFKHLEETQSDIQNRKQSLNDYEVTILPDPTVWDGRFANNGWLQELPKPLTHIVWDNPAWISPSDASRMQLQNGDIVRLNASDRNVKIPIWIIPGQPPGSITLFRGSNHIQSASVSRDVGFDVSQLIGIQRVRVEPTGQHHQIVTTQHFQLMEGRHLARSGTLSEYQQNPKHPEFAHPPSPLPEASVYPPWEYDGHKWGMTIDLTACVGCSACVIACQSENNIPVVGKTQCNMNRHMHWIRVDTYYKGPVEAPTQTLHQPVPCMQCEHAPCEVVCPVAATSHSDEGINQMIYNRCIGTRYCSNNCPYKVRRFNFHDYSNDFISSPVMELLSNPEVTLRSRGVMEKCTYCIQRVENARIQSHVRGQPIQDGDIQMACQAACPAEAIRFGDLNDPASQVATAANHPLNYGLLEGLNTKPRTTYLAEVRKGMGRA